MTFYIGTPHTHNAGYHWDGYGAGKEQNDVQTCPHCQAVILMQQWKKAQSSYFCTRCFKPTCGQPACESKGCVPFAAKLEREFDMTMKLHQFMKDAGLTPEPARPLFTGIITE